MSTQSVSGSAGHLGLVKSVSYSLPHLVTSFLVIPVWSVLPGIYATHFGMALTTIATVFLVARVFDAAMDPVIGYLSDRYRTCTGTRKPWMVAGAIFYVVASYFLYVPPQQVSATYFLIWFLIFYLAWTLFEIPHIVWAGELTQGAKDRTQLFSVRILCGYLGALLFYAVPSLPFFTTPEFTPETLKWAVLSMGAVMLPVLYVCMRTVPDGRMGGLPDAASHKPESVRIVFASIVENKPFLLFLSAYFIAGAGSGMWVGLTFIFIDSYLQLGSKFSAVHIWGMLAAFIAVLGFYRLAGRLVKSWAWAGGMTLTALAIAGTASLQPGEETFIPLAVLTVLAYVGGAAVTVHTPSVLADIVDYGSWKFGTDRAGTYFSAYTFITKANMGIGGALGLAFAGWFGFDPAATIHSEQGIFGLRLAMGYIPALIMLIAVVFAVMTPIDARRHQIIMRRLDSRQKAAKREVK